MNVWIYILFMRCEMDKELIAGGEVTTGLTVVVTIAIII